MHRVLPLLLLATPWVAGQAMAQSHYLSAYGGGSGSNYLSAYSGGGGSGDYRSALNAYQGGGGYGFGTSNGYSGAYAATYAHSRGGFAPLGGQWGWANALRGNANPAPPCGNFQRAAVRCRKTTTAWDPTFVSQRGW
ncbi:MAG: hypothetical protein INF43_04735 [Alphaproteobacteria bacterium]|jgi:hypothetical protein|nr:hypothetical protein [Alphaproteobacteria bacterium]